MKDSRYANRGSALEELLRMSNESYRRKGIALIEKIPTEFLPIRDHNGRVVSFKVTHKASVDFIGRWHDHPISIEAKQTSSDAIRLDAVQENQARILDEFMVGGLGCVVVSFGGKRFFTVPWEFWGDAYDVRVRQSRRDSDLVVKAHGMEWDVPKKLSVRAEELLPEWEVFMGIGGLNYLEERIWGRKAE